jgi:hypothetical protein
MRDKIVEIINSIDDYLEQYGQLTTDPVEISPFLESKGILNDSKSRPGSPIRIILRKGLIPHAYQDGNKWHIPKSKNKKITASTYNNVGERAIKKPEKKSQKRKKHKLESIAESIVQFISDKYDVKVDFILEYKPKWLGSFPSFEIVTQHPELSKLYSELNNSETSLLNKIEELSTRNFNQKQSFDIWIGSPFNFAIEFDEKQHFNQFREITLAYYNNLPIKFPLTIYKEFNQDILFKPGKSGFTKLKSNDPLFPELLLGEKQDNRIRQRAFRDYLKDLLPILNGFNATLRIPYQVVDNKINNFSEDDITKIINYISKYNLL